ncbi:DNA primase [Propionimicrobium sp. PCR01-08-3]|uniref:DNA primase n=1 Tax=Propionimicrobium sp. PCR01-08-3 TaxID=3052086 RepID=UPI00255D03DF|nr:DNA primase [Propionimicrobium sp. PCR01-08-3]WIY81448.1 DNA primase [Propionimicrobium sp. PCR01-08-3]
MATRINEEDIALVRERARIDEIIGAYVQLRNAGGGSLKGLCPFHDEKTPSFQVTPSRGFYYCFGCGEGGDVITFLEKIDNLSFTEAVQTLADKTGVQLRISDDGRPAAQPGLRQRVLAANQAAAEFYQAQITTPEAVIFRQFVDGRGFDRQAAEHFGMGYAPKDGRALHHHLNRAGFSDEELVKAGLIRESGWDYFQGRVLWPIRDSAKSVLGFGARRVFDDDRMPAKYINTPETVCYKKSHVLYGLDLARQPIGKKSQAVVVEGYTDVMACHLSGIDTAVASCGTAFGADHARMLQRLMGNNDAFNGEIVFTFDGDAAGQAAALKVFNLDRAFVSQTYVAVEPNGLDPCDLRLQSGEPAVRELVGRRVPLYRFVMRNVVKQYDLDRVDGRVQAVRAAAPLVSSVRDASLVRGYLHDLSQLVGMDVEEVRRIVSQQSRRAMPTTQVPPMRTVRPSEDHDEGPTLDGLSLPWPDPFDRNIVVERDTLKLMLQHPVLFDTAWNGVSADDFTHPAYRAIFEVIAQTPYQPQGWAEQLQEATGDDVARQLEVALLVEGVHHDPDEAYASAYTAKLQLLSTMRRLTELKSRLQRINPVDNPSAHKQAFSELIVLETTRRTLEQISSGAD